MKKRLLALAMAAALTLGLASCVPQTPPDATPSAPASASPAPTVSATPTPSAAPGAALPALNDGIYTATVDARNGDMTVELTVKDGKMSACQVTAHEETAGVADPAIERLPKSLIEQQTLALDTVAGATITSEALLAAMADCITQAGGDPEAFRVQAGSKPQGSGELIRKDVDLVVVGSGGAGLSAAVTAAEMGGKVLVLEKLPGIGGNTARTGASMNAADITREQLYPMSVSEEEVRKTFETTAENPQHQVLMSAVQRQWEAYQTRGDTYIFDSPEFHALQTYEGGDRKGDLSLIQTMCNNAYQARCFLETHGTVWNDEVFMIIGSLYNRCIEPVGDIFQAYVGNLADSAKQNGVEILTETPATELIVENGRVVGVKAENTANGDQYEIYGAKGVVLATGGYAANQELVKEYHDVDVALTSNSPGCTGDGLFLAQGAGAELVGMDYIQIHPLGNPKSGALALGYGGVVNPIFVNREGKRFVNEQGRRDEISLVMLQQTDSMAFSFIDDATGAEVLGAQERGDAFIADTIDEVCALAGVDAAQLKATVEAYNAMVSAGADTEFGKPSLGRQLLKAPFALVPVTPTVHHTMGGVRIDTAARVLDADGFVINGLFAAGEVTGGIHGSNRVGGNAITDIIVFGRIAGATAMGQ